MTSSLCGPSKQGTSLGIPSKAPLCKEDVTELLDAHYLKLVRYLETFLDQMKFTPLPVEPESKTALATLSGNDQIVTPNEFKVKHSLAPPESSCELETLVPGERSPAVPISARQVKLGFDEIDSGFPELRSSSSVLLTDESVISSALSALQPADHSQDAEVISFEQSGSEEGSDKLHAASHRDLGKQTNESLDSGEVGDGYLTAWTPMHKRVTSVLQIPPHREKQIDLGMMTVAETRSNFAGKQRPTILTWLVLDALNTALNTAFVGVRLEYDVREKSMSRYKSQILEVGSLFFCIWFALDLLRRLCHEKGDFFAGSQKAWNLFDAVIVVSMLLDGTARRSAADLGVHFGITWISAFRIVRLFKQGAILSLLRRGRELKILFRMLSSCCAGIFWLFVLTLLMTYLFALVLTQGAAEMCPVASSKEDVCQYFGSLSVSFIYMYGAVLGAFPWTLLVNDLTILGALPTMAFLCFVTVAQLVLMNALLSTVVLTHRKIDDARADLFLKNEMRQQLEYIEMVTKVFNKIDIDVSGAISREEFLFSLEEPIMVSMLDSLGMEVHDVDAIFNLLDVDDSNCIQIKEFVYACMRFKGNAKSIDMIRLIGEVDSLKATLEEMQTSLQQQGARSRLPSLTLGTSSGLLPGQALGREFSDETHTRNSTRVSTKASTMMYHEMNVRDELIQEAKHSTRGHQQRIPLVEERAMTLKELFFVKKIIDLLCLDEAWQDVRLGGDLQPTDVNLYDFSHHFICPVTLPNGVVFRKIAPSGEFAVGQEVIQSNKNDSISGLGNIKAVFDDGSLRVRVLLGRFTDSSPISVADAEYTPQSLEVTDHISFKEFLSSKPLKPTWFCSHWWGESIYNFVSCVERHGQIHRSSWETSGYWVCAYANNQHNLSLEMGGAIEFSSFRKAMSLARGVLLILDSSATAFKRIWCDFEVYRAVVDKKDLDVATVRKHAHTGHHNQSVCLLTGGIVPGETSHQKMRRELGFPSRILVQGLRTKLENGKASVPSDKEQILQNMAKDVNISSDDFHERVKFALKKANAAFNAYFALAAWPVAVKRRVVDDFDRQRLGSLALPAVLAEDSSRRSLALDFSHLDMMSDKDMESLAKGFPPALDTLELSFKNCIGISDLGFACLVNALDKQKGLRKIQLSLISCPCITDKSLLALAHVLPDGLSELHLNFGACKQISVIGVRSIARSLTSDLTNFSGTFGEASLNCNFNNLQDFKAWFAGDQSAKGVTQSSHSFFSKVKRSTRTRASVVISALASDGR